MITTSLFKHCTFRSIAAAMALLMAGFSVDSQAAYEFVSTFGSRGTAFGQFSAPRGVTINNQGEIVVTESGNHRVQICNELGNCSGFGSFGFFSGEFDRPRDVVVNSMDRIFIADRGNDRIASCSRTGSCTDFGGSGVVVGKFESPRGIAIDPQDRFYITDTDNNRVQICRDTGVCSAFGGFGTAQGQFNSPTGIAVDSQGRIIIADRGNNRIQICSAQGTGCTAFGTLGSAPGQFNGPAGLAVDSKDRIIVVDRFNDRVQVCTQQGSCTAFGSFGSGQGQFNLPWGVAVDDQDRIIVADLGNDRIQIFAEPAAIPINTGLNDAWYYPVTDGQGFFINVFPNAGVALVAWFTYDTARPDASVPANLGDPGHRWLLAVGPYSGNQAVLDIEIASGGIFDTATAIDRVTDGTITLSFSDCRTGVIEYDIPSINQQGIVPIERIVADNIGLCEALINQPAAQRDSTVQSAETVAPVPEAVPGFSINTGLNDAWYYPVTDGQGYFVNVFPNAGLALVAWFTYDTVRPDASVPANLGDPGHRWLLAVGPYSGNQAILDVEIASGGIFDTATAIDRATDGTITLTFSDCSNGVIEYDIPSINQQGIVPIERIVADNIALCEAF